MERGGGVWGVTGNLNVWVLSIPHSILRPRCAWPCCSSLF